MKSEQLSDACGKRSLKKRLMGPKVRFLVQGLSSKREQKGLKSQPLHFNMKTDKS